MDKEVIVHIHNTIKKILVSSVFKSTGIYTIANFTNGAIPFFLLPVLTQYLTPADYGITATFGVLLVICTPLISLNTNVAVSIKYFKIAKDEFPQYVSNCLLLIIINCLIVTIFFVFFNSLIEKISLFPGDWLWAVIVACFGGNVISILLMILRSVNRVYPYVIVQFFQVVLNIGLSVYFVVWFQMNWQGRIVANVIAIIFFTIISIAVLYKTGWLVLKYNFAHIKDAVKFGVPLLTNNIANFVVSALDRIIIAQLIGLSAVGIYSVGVNFGQVIWAVIGSVNNAYSPWLFHKLNTATEKVKSKIVLISYGYAIGLLIFAIMASHLMPFIIKIFVSEKFYESLEIIFWIFSAQAFVGMEIIMCNFIHYAERTRSFLWVDIFTSILHLINCYLFVKENGIIGAAQALIITRFVRFLVIWFISDRIYPMPWFSFYKSKL
jgi:O-antigen/teichoic acid export membrane protein